jgi:putative ABC transport system substrate-binding protein
MKRRAFLALAGGAVLCPGGARAQTADEYRRRIGVLSNLAEHDPEGRARLEAFLQALATLGWIEGRNLDAEVRWGAGDRLQIQRHAAELVKLAPDAILATGASTMGPLQSATRTVPIVFVNVVDPVGAGFVEGLARPGGNATGFTQFDHDIAAKWLEILKQTLPALRRLIVLQDPAVSSGVGQIASIRAAAPRLGVAIHPLDIRDIDSAEAAIATLAQAADSGMIVLSGAAALHHRERIIDLAARHRLPAIYPYRLFVASGGLMSYGPDSADAFRQAAGYVDRILRGERPADLPVQTTTRFELIINLRTAKSLDLSLPEATFARADEVVE